MKALLTTLFVALSIVASAQTGDSTATQSITDQFLTELLAFTKDAGAFAKEEIPLVLKEYVKWGVVKSIVWLIPILILGFYMPRYWRWGWDKADDSEGFSMFGVILGTIPWAIVLMAQSLNLAKALFAPRVYLIEKLSDLIK